MKATGNPTYTNSGLGSVGLDGSSYFQNSSGLNFTNSSSAPFSVFIVAMMTEVNRTLFTTSTVNDFCGYIPLWHGLTYIMGGGGNNWITATSTTTSTTATYMHSIICTGGSTSGLISVQVNGLNNNTHPLIGGNPAGTFDRSTFLLGGRNVTGGPKEFMKGEIYEVIMFNSALSNAQQAQIEGYLAWKWAIKTQLPSTHPYRTSSP